MRPSLTQSHAPSAARCDIARITVCAIAVRCSVGCCATCFQKRVTGIPSKAHPRARDHQIYAMPSLRSNAPYSAACTAIFMIWAPSEPGGMSCSRGIICGRTSAEVNYQLSAGQNSVLLHCATRSVSWCQFKTCGAVKQLSHHIRAFATCTAQPAYTAHASNNMAIQAVHGQRSTHHGLHVVRKAHHGKRLRQVAVNGQRPDGQLAVGNGREVPVRGRNAQQACNIG